MSEVEKYGVKELEEIMVFGLIAGKQGFAALSDGFQYADVFALVPLVQLAPAAIQGADEALKEASDLSDAEVDHLIAVVQAIVKDLPAEKAKKIALKAFQLGLVAIQLVNELKA
jgi:uncharacterized small protein (DUF1192 family)